MSHGGITGTKKEQARKTIRAQLLLNANELEALRTMILAIIRNDWSLSQRVKYAALYEDLMSLAHKTQAASGWIPKYLYDSRNY